jgi:hypothetical protein
MKILLTLSVQKEFEATSDEDADAKITAMQQALEAQGYVVQIESDDILDEEEEEKETEEETEAEGPEEEDPGEEE